MQEVIVLVRALTVSVFQGLSIWRPQLPVRYSQAKNAEKFE
jgi:hypothetical protein